MDKTENSSRADSQPPWVDLIPVSLRQCKKSNTLQNVACTRCALHLVSTRSLGHYAWECISGILSPEDTWHYGNDPSNFRLCCKPPSYVPYKGTYVPYDGTFGTPGQGQTLDVWGDIQQMSTRRCQWHFFAEKSPSHPGRKSCTNKDIAGGISAMILDHTDKK